MIKRFAVAIDVTGLPENAVEERVQWAKSAVTACSGLSLPSDVPVGALREVVEALRGLLEANHKASMDNENIKTRVEGAIVRGKATDRAWEALSQLSEKGETKNERHT